MDPTASGCPWTIGWLRIKTSRNDQAPFFEVTSQIHIEPAFFCVWLNVASNNRIAEARSLRANRAARFIPHHSSGGSAVSFWIDLHSAKPHALQSLAEFAVEPGKVSHFFGRDLYPRTRGGQIANAKDPEPQ